MGLRIHSTILPYFTIASRLLFVFALKVASRLALEIDAI